METVYLKLGRRFREAKALSDHLVATQLTAFNEWNYTLCEKMKTARDFLSGLGTLLRSLPHANSIIIRTPTRKQTRSKEQMTAGLDDDFVDSSQHVPVLSDI